MESGNQSQCNTPGFEYDQRGEARSYGVCDTGAVERQAEEPEPIFVDGFEWGDVQAWQ